MSSASRLLTLDSNILIAALKKDEVYSEECSKILLSSRHLYLGRPSILYQEVCGTLARRVGISAAEDAGRQLDMMIPPRLLVTCDRGFSIAAYPLCSNYGIHAIDAVYLKVALDAHGILVSLDKEGFIDKIRSRNPDLQAYHVSELPY
ncbi:MAG: PIN domain-containing protein [Candidatus Bathyarchaeia archaeon]